MRRRILLTITVLALLAAVPSGAQVAYLDRYVPASPGTEKDLTVFYGPFLVPPGHDMNRITLDLPVHGGFFTAIAPNLVDARTGEEPSDQEAHIHHAHWLRATNDPQDELYYNFGFGWGLSWVFGTGEEKTQGSLADRSALEPSGIRYGIYIKKNQPQTLIYMLHNKTPQPLNLYVVLNVHFIYGTADEIRTANGKEFRALTGKLWGNTFDVPRDAAGDGSFVFPVEVWPGDTRQNPLGAYFTAGWSGTVVATAGHLHPAGREVVIANLGPAGSGCEADSDFDGYPGITILHSRKMDRVPEAFPFSEDYQMGVSKFGFRAPIRLGDRITQFGVYSNRDHAAYGAMSYAGLYLDKLQVPPAATGCNVASYGSVLLTGDPVGGDSKEGILNHAWQGDPDPLCGPSVGPACEQEELLWAGRVPVDTVHIAGFAYLPGNQSYRGPHRLLPQIAAGSQLRFVNDDAPLGIRHTITSCRWPCNGGYVANYPLPDGTFDSRALGFSDPIDGSPTKVEWKTPPELGSGLYSFYCRIHPWMRGAFEVA